MNRFATGFGFVLLSALFFAVSGPVAKTLYAIGWTPGSVVLVRMAGSALVLAVPTLIALHGRWSDVWAHWRTVVVYGLVSMVGVQLLYFIAVAHLSVAVALLLEMTAPLMIVVWTWMRTRVRPSTLTFVGMGAAVIGLVLVLDLRSAQFSLVGVLCALGAAVCLASYFLVSAKSDVPIPPVALTGLGMTVGTVIMAVVVGTGLMDGVFVTEPVDFAAAEMSWIVPLLLIVLATAGAYVFGIVGSRMIGATVTSFINLIEVPFSVLAAWWIVAELPSWIQAFGGVFILAGVVFIKLGENRMAARQVILSEMHPDPVPEAAAALGETR